MRLRGTNRNFRRVSNQQVPFNPKKLFRNGEQGVHYDPSDFSRYMQTGPETVSNGTFDTGTVGWTQALGSISAVGGRLRAARSADGASAGRAYTAIQCVPGKTYLFTVERYKAQTGGTTVRIGVLANGSSVGAVQLDTSTVDGFYRTTFVATQAEHYVILESGSGTSSQYAEFDNVSVQELIALESCTLFQDSAGTTPVTAVEQPVGLMLDKSKGTTPGPELKGTGSVFSLGVSNIGTYNPTTGQGSAWRVDAANQSGVQFAAPVGVFHAITITVSSGSIGIRSGRIDGSVWVTVNPGTTTVRVPGGGTGLISITNGVGGEGTFTVTSIKEIPGNHAFQTTAIDRPVLSNRYNLLTKTEQFDDALWSKSASGTGVGPVVTANFGTDPSGFQNADRVQLNSGAAGSSVVSQSFSTTTARHEFSIWMRSLTSSVTVTMFCLDNIQNVTVTTVWQRFTFARTPGALSAIDVRIAKRDTWSSTGVADLLVWGASIVPADQSALPYQRVNTATDYDADPTKFPLYLAANGTNTWMQTNSINFTGTDKVTVFAGLRKLSDATTGMAVELSTSASAGNPGTLYIVGSSPTGVYQGRTAGTQFQIVNSAAYPAPHSSVLCLEGDIAADLMLLRVNKVQTSASLDQGTGNFGNYPLYLFRRGGTNLPFNGRLYGLLIRGALTSDPDILKMERWLALKTGVQL